jgi:hypothetical protein
MSLTPPFPTLRLPQPALGWLAIFALVGLSALCLVAQVGGVLRLLFPAGALAVGGWLYWRYPLLYVGFTWWIWFLSPWVRRVVDQQGGWVDPSPILLAPLLVALVTLVTLVRSLPKSLAQGGLPFLLCLLAVVYGWLVGLIQNSPVSAILECLGWITPILFGFHLFMFWQQYPACRHNLQRIFLWGTLLMGGYGVWQYLTAPEWDRFWMVNAGLNSIGTPETLGIRVFSTMNAPQPFAGVLMAGLMLLFCDRASLRFAAGGVGYLAFLLSSARSAWLSWLVALLSFLPALKARLQMQLIGSLLVLAIVVIPLINLEPFSTVIAPRLQSLSNVESDGSYAARSSGYNQLLGEILTNPIGRGFGASTESGEIGARDSGILALFLALGWLGGIPYLVGIGLIFFRLFQGAEGRVDAFAGVARSIALGTFSQIGLNVATAGAIGMVLWSFLGIGMAANQFYQQRERSR